MEQCPVGKKQSYEDENQHNRIWDQVGYASQTDHKKSQVNSQLFRFWLFFYWLGSYVYRCRGKHAGCRNQQNQRKGCKGKHTHQESPCGNRKGRGQIQVLGITYRTMVEINSFCCPVIVRIIMPKGTNVSSDTSLVMNMLEKKHSRESTSINCRVVRTFVSSAEPRK